MVDYQIDLPLGHSKYMKLTPGGTLSFTPSALDSWLF